MNHSIAVWEESLLVIHLTWEGWKRGRERGRREWKASECAVSLVSLVFPAIHWLKCWIIDSPLIQFTIQVFTVSACQWPLLVTRTLTHATVVLSRFFRLSLSLSPFHYRDSHPLVSVSLRHLLDETIASLPLPVPITHSPCVRSWSTSCCDGARKSHCHRITSHSLCICVSQREAIFFVSLFLSFSLKQ